MDQSDALTNLDIESRIENAESVTNTFSKDSNEA